jgi:thiol-disulfide isomerase/thioredoxin
MAWSRTLTLTLALFVCLAARQAAAETLLLEFSAAGCGPCRLMQPVMQKVAADGFKIRQVDIAHESDLASRFKIDQVPTFVVLVNGQERARLIGGGRQELELVQMIRTAEAIAAAAAPAQVVAPKKSPALDFVDHTTGEISSQDAASLEPRPGRIVQINAQPPIARESKSASTAVAAECTASITANDVSHLIAATVRLSIEDPEGRSTGTGTIIDAREGKALVLTCGHLFRTSSGKGAIEISLFTAGANGAEMRSKVEGTLIDYDLDRDLALVCFVPDGPVAVAPVAPEGTQTPAGTPVTSVGCEHGANPTPWTSRITAVNRFQGHPNIEAAGAPVEGRSGGGLFNGAGQLVGVCYAADPQGNEGLYASLPSIHAKLDSLNLAMVHRTPSTGLALSASASTAPSQVAANPPYEVRGQNPAPTATSPFPELPARVPAPPAATSPTPVASSSGASGETTPLSSEEHAALAEINRRGAEAEVICIIRPRTPNGRSEVIKLDRASPAFVRALGGSTPPAAAAGPSASTAALSPASGAAGFTR